VKKAMKFLADMPISPKTIEFLQSIGHDAVRLTSIGMQSAEDEEILEYARLHDYIVLTMDLDYGGILAHGGFAKPSVITFRLKNPEVVRINGILQEVLPQIKQDLGRGALVIIEEFRTRVRDLPI
jgi:predicted nuclease of predicted toxin-antitoxin system